MMLARKDTPVFRYDRRHPGVEHTGVRVVGPYSTLFDRHRNVPGYGAAGPSRYDGSPQNAQSSRRIALKFRCLRASRP